MKNAGNKVLTNHFIGEGGDVKLDYSVPKHSIKGSKVIELSGFRHGRDCFEAGLKKVRERTQKGVTIVTNVVDLSVVDLVRCIKESGRPYPLIYASHQIKSTASSQEIKIWMEKRDERDLITELAHIRGWEDNIVMVFEYGYYDIDNMCLRAVSHLIILSLSDNYEDDEYDTEEEEMNVIPLDNYEDDEYDTEEEEMDVIPLVNEINNRLSFINHEFLQEATQNQMEDYSLNDDYKKEIKNSNMDDIGKENNTKRSKDWFQKGFLIGNIQEKGKQVMKEKEAKGEDVKEKSQPEWFQKGFLLKKMWNEKEDPG